MFDGEVLGLNKGSEERTLQETYESQGVRGLERQVIHLIQ